MFIGLSGWFHSGVPIWTDQGLISINKKKASINQFESEVNLSLERIQPGRVLKCLVKECISWIEHVRHGNRIGFRVYVSLTRLSLSVKNVFDHLNMGVRGSVCVIEFQCFSCESNWKEAWCTYCFYLFSFHYIHLNKQSHIILP